VNRREFIYRLNILPLSGIALPTKHSTAWLASGATGVSPKEPENYRPLVIRGGTVFDSEAKRMIPDQVILIRGERIESVGSPNEVKAPHDAEVFEATGKYLIPGLIDAHVHITHVLYRARMTGDEIMPFFLGNGVTTVRSTGDNVPAQMLIERYAAPDLSPRIFRCSFLIGNDPPYHQDVGWSLTAADQVPPFVSLMAGWGVTTLKVYANCLPSVGRKVIEEGHRHGLVVTGHLESYPASQAIDDGIDCLEHIETVSDFLRVDPKDRHSLDITGDAAKRLVEKIVDHKVYVDPTLMVFYGMLFFVDVPEIMNYPDNFKMPKRLRDFWTESRAINYDDYSSGPLSVRRATFKKYQELVGILHRAGANILVGTDSAEPQVPPGYSLHHEMELLVESGMTPADVLAAATISNARVLKQEANLGSISAAKLADIVVLDANPLEDIRNSRKIHRVVKGGRVLDPRLVLSHGPTE
jgi:Amidohydrolase family